MPKNQSTDSIASISSNSTDCKSPIESRQPKLLPLLSFPPLYEDTIISNMVSIFFNLVDYNTRHKYHADKKDTLFSKRIPKLSIEDFLIHVVTYSKIELSTLLSMYIYAMRLITRNEFVLRYSNVYKLLLGACVLSVKFNEDKKFPFSYYAKIGGMTVSELSEVEFSIYTRLNFELFVNEDELNESVSVLLQL